jgi:lactate 2-monooxygenase
MSGYGDYQFTFYQAGLEGKRPTLPLTYPELEKQALALLDPRVAGYVTGGAGDEYTQDENAKVFDKKWGIIPRMLNDAAERDLSIDLFGLKLPTPIFLAPIGVIGVMSFDLHGDLATARAAAETKVPMMPSTLSQDPLEDVHRTLGETPGFFQLYTSKDREITESLVRRVETAGFKAIAITADTRALGWRPRDLYSATTPQFHGYCLQNYFTDPVFRSRLDAPPEEDKKAAIALWQEIFGNPTLSWSEVEWIRSLTSLPVIVKGICHPDDARHAVDLGMDGIYCSNHGGRQVNSAPALDMLPEVVAAAGDKPVLFDSGIRTGVDIVKALALGAAAVGIGRPYAYGLPLAATEGVVHVVRTLLAEAELTMAINGYKDVESLRQGALIRL